MVNTTDEIYVDAPAEDVYRELLTFGKDPSWWPGAVASSEGRRIAVTVPSGRISRVRFEADIDHVRPDEGLTWVFVTGDLTGRGEWWLEPFKDGTIVHYYLEAGTEAEVGGSLDKRVDRHRVAVRRGLNALKDHMEGR